MRTEHIVFDGNRFPDASGAERHENDLFEAWLKDPQESVNLQDLLESLPDTAISGKHYSGTPRYVAKTLLKEYFLGQQEHK